MIVTIAGYSTDIGQLAYEIYEILEEHDDGLTETTSKSQVTFHEYISKLKL